MQIIEFLPNPTGKDTEGEWIKIFNNTNAEINLNGWQIKDASGKSFIFTNQKITINETLTLNYQTTKISLNNNGETLFLYNSIGNLIDKAEYSGTASNGEIFKRQGEKFISTKQSTTLSTNKQQAANTDNYENIELQTANIKTTINPINKTNYIDHILIGFVIALTLGLLSTALIKKLDLINKE